MKKTRAGFPAVAAQSMLTASGAYENVFSYFASCRARAAQTAHEKTRRGLPAVAAQSILTASGAYENVFSYLTFHNKGRMGKRNACPFP
jgi:hypothetical protein